MILPHIVFFKFLAGIGEPFVPPPPEPVVPTGGKGDNKTGDARRRGRYSAKPLGLPLTQRAKLPAVQERIEESAEIAAEVRQEARERVDRIEEPTFEPISAMTQEAIMAEIGMLMRRGLEKENEQRMLLLLLAASV